MIAGAFAKTILVSGSELEGMFSALRSIACLIACPPCPCSVFSRLPSPSWSVGRFFRTCSLPYCVPADLGGVAPCALVETWTSPNFVV